MCCKTFALIYNRKLEERLLNQTFDDAPELRHRDLVERQLIEAWSEHTTRSPGRINQLLKIAACFLLAVGSLLLWNSSHNPNAELSEEAFLANLEVQLNDAEAAARLLAAADILATHASIRDYVLEKYQYIADTYPDVKAGNEAKLRLNKL